MKKPKLHVTILKENVGYSATIVSKNKFIASEADTFDLLLTHLVEAINLTFEEYGFTYQVTELKFTYDLESFFLQADLKYKLYLSHSILLSCQFQRALKF